MDIPQLERMRVWEKTNQPFSLNDICSANHAGTWVFPGLLEY